MVANDLPASLPWELVIFSANASWRGCQKRRAECKIALRELLEKKSMNDPLEKRNVAKSFPQLTFSAVGGIPKCIVIKCPTLLSFVLGIFFFFIHSMSSTPTLGPHPLLHQFKLTAQSLKSFPRFSTTLHQKFLCSWTNTLRRVTHVSFMKCWAWEPPPSLVMLGE